MKEKGPVAQNKKISMVIKIFHIGCSLLFSNPLRVIPLDLIHGFIWTRTPPGTIVITVTSKDKQVSDPFFNFDQKLRITKDF